MPRDVAVVSPTPGASSAAVATSASVGLLLRVVRVGDEYLTLGEGPRGPIAWRSADGRTWTKVASVPDTVQEGREGNERAGGPCSYRTSMNGVSDGRAGVVAVGRTHLKSGGYRAVVWILQ